MHSQTDTKTPTLTRNETCSKHHPTLNLPKVKLPSPTLLLVFQKTFAKFTAPLHVQSSGEFGERNQGQMPSARNTFAAFREPESNQQARGARRGAGWARIPSASALRRLPAPSLAAQLSARPAASGAGARAGASYLRLGPASPLTALLWALAGRGVRLRMRPRLRRSPSTLPPVRPGAGGGPCRI